MTMAYQGNDLILCMITYSIAIIKKLVQIYIYIYIIFDKIFDVEGFTYHKNHKMNHEFDLLRET